MVTFSGIEHGGARIHGERVERRDRLVALLGDTRSSSGPMSSETLVARIELYRQAQRVLTRDAPVAFLYANERGGS